MSDEVPAQDRSNVAAVHDRLRLAILSGDLEAGATVRQAALATEFEVGRTPLREALRMLQSEGLVEAEHNRQVRIAGFSAADFEDLYLMRISLETVAIRLTVPALSVDDLAALEGHMARMDHYAKAGHRPGFAAAHRAFHLLLVSGVGAGTLTEIARLIDHTARYRTRFGGGRIRAKSQAEHRAIADAAVAADPDAAVECLALHYARTAGLVLGALDPGFELARLRTVLRTVAPAAEPALQVAG